MRYQGRHRIGHAVRLEWWMGGVVTVGYAIATAGQDAARAWMTLENPERACRPDDYRRWALKRLGIG